MESVFYGIGGYPAVSVCIRVPLNSTQIGTAKGGIITDSSFFDLCPSVASVYIRVPLNSTQIGTAKSRMHTDSVR